MITNDRGQKSSNYYEEAWHKAISSCRTMVNRKWLTRFMHFSNEKVLCWQVKITLFLPTTFSHLDAYHTNDRLSPPEDMQNSIVFQAYFSYKFFSTISYS